MRGILLRQRRQRPSEDLRPWRMDHECANNETQRYESEHRNAFLNDAERAFPHHKPDHDRRGHGPPHELDSGGEFECDANAANLGRQNKQAHEREHEVEKRKVVEAKSFANRVGYRASANSGEASSLFNKEDDAETTEHNRPDQSK